MQSIMLINARHPEESRVAVVENGVLQNLEVEYAGRGQTKGNVYKGIVARIEPSIHAVFVDYGGGKHGFLPFSEIHPSCYGRDTFVEGASEGGKPTIEKNLKNGQEVLVQVVKEERDTKGAYLTTYLSIAGRYLVLMPGSKKGGVSRRIDSEEERKKLKEIVSSLGVPEDTGVIIRTAGMGRAKSDLKRDFNNLMRVWSGIKKKAKSQKAPASIFQEGDIVLRSIRDYFTSDIKEIVIDNTEVLKRAKDFMKLMMPRYQNRVRLHKETVPLFSHYDLEEQIEAIYGNKVRLRSGGSIVIDPTEALVSIDVNSGRMKGEKGIEDTAFKTNMEAAEEIARQLRLRDLGGLIVIDFIDMRHKSNIVQVEKTLKAALKQDKARIGIGRISKFGLLEMSRQRLRSSLIERSFVNCPHCGGSGTIKSVESNAIYLLRKIHEAAMGEHVEKIDLLLSAEIATDLSNRKREEILKIEKDHNVKVYITGQTGIPVNSFNLEVAKKKEIGGGGKLEKPEKLAVKLGENKERPRKKYTPRKRKPAVSGEGDRGKEQNSSKVHKEEVAGKSREGADSQKGLLTRIRAAIKGD